MFKTQWLAIILGIIVSDVYASESESCMVRTADGPPQPIINVQDVGIAAAIKAVEENGSGTLLFPSGDYFFGKRGQYPYFELKNMRNLHIVGEGPDSTLILASPISDGERQGRILNISDSENVRISCLKFSGQRAKFRGIKEQQNNVFIRRTKNVIVENIISEGAFGDGLNLGDVQNVHVLNSKFDNNERNGITFGHGISSNLHVTKNIFGAGIDTQQIDFEHGEYSNVLISGNEFERMQPEDLETRDQFAITITSVDGAKVVNNRVNNPILVRNSSNVELLGNKSMDQLTIDRDSVGVLVVENEFSIKAGNRKVNKGVAGVLAIGRARLFPDNLRIERNTFNFSAPYEHHLFISDVRSFTLKDNVFINTNQDIKIGLESNRIDIEGFIDANVIVSQVAHNNHVLETKVTKRIGKKVTLREVDFDR